MRDHDFFELELSVRKLWEEVRALKADKPKVSSGLPEGRLFTDSEGDSIFVRICEVNQDELAVTLRNAEDDETIVTINAEKFLEMCDWAKGVIEDETT